MAPKKVVATVARKSERLAKKQTSRTDSAQSGHIDDTAAEELRNIIVVSGEGREPQGALLDTTDNYTAGDLMSGEFHRQHTGMSHLQGRKPVRSQSCNNPKNTPGRPRQTTRREVTDVLSSRRRTSPASDASRQCHRVRRRSGSSSANSTSQVRLQVVGRQHSALPGGAQTHTGQTTVFPEDYELLVTRIRVIQHLP